MEEIKVLPEFTCLVDDYKARKPSMTEYEKAVAERAIYDACPKELRRREPAVTLRSIIGGSTFELRHRRDLINAGAEAQPLWEHVNSGMPCIAAVRIFKAARCRTASGVSLADALKATLDEYNKGLTRHLPNGKVIRMRAPSRLPDTAAGVSFHPKKKRALAKDGTRVFYNELRDLVAQMRDLVLAYASDRLGGIGVPEIEIRRVCERFEIDVQASIDELRTSFRTVALSEKRTQASDVSRRQVIDACRALAMDPPQPGKAVDIKLAKQQKKRHARLYHPDAHVGSPNKDKMRSQYEAVIAAYQMIESYNDSLTRARS